jgi:hypothetical protein
MTARLSDLDLHWHGSPVCARPGAAAHSCAVDATVLPTLAPPTTGGHLLLPLRLPLAHAFASRCDPPPLPARTPAPDSIPIGRDRSGYAV